jgi:hypothetical protein
MILITWLKVHNTEQDFLMFKYMTNIIWYGSFRITSCINPRPILSLELKLSGWYWCLGLIRDLIRKEPYNILYILINDLDYAIVVLKDKICLVWVNQKQEIIMAAIFFASSRRKEVIKMWTVNDDDGREVNNGRKVITKLHLVFIWAW